MEIIGLIAEYNPFHNGHFYQIKKIKEMYPDSLIILVLNGYFLERGEISIQTKQAKTKIALTKGIDIVLELPSIFGTQSSDIFANIALKILNNYHITKLVFGSECNDIKVLQELAQKQNNPSFNNQVKAYLNEGLNYPTAMAKSLNTDFTFSPNDLLGISYIKAIINNNYPIEPITIKRTSNYHDTTSNNKIISATNIRNKIKEQKDITKYLPPDSLNSIITPNYELFFQLLKAKIITEDNLAKYLDVDEGIEYRLKKYINVNSYNEYIKQVKNKRFTYNKLNRMFIHILLGLEKNQSIPLSYIKILGFNLKGKQYLNSIKDNLIIPNTIKKDSIQYNFELKSSYIYDLICNTNTIEFELSTIPVIL